MKKDIHPAFQETVFKCACGAEIHTLSTQPEYKLEICSSCHPFFTGKQKLVDSAGRVERFMKKYGEKAVTADKKPAKTRRRKPAKTAAKGKTTKKTGTAAKGRKKSGTAAAKPAKTAQKSDAGSKE